ELSAGPWLGAASSAMTAATAPYVAWMRSTATQAEQTASQAKAAAAAYEVTFAAMVPPPVIAANRALLQALVATNLFGQNTPAIAATETLYAEMWDQEATALYGLASTAATNAAPAAALDTLSDLAGLILFLPGVAQAGLTPLNTVGLFTDLSFDDDELHFEGLESTAQDILKPPPFNGFHLPPDVALESGLTRPAMALGPTEVASVTAGLGRAPTVGTLSVPQ